MSLTGYDYTLNGRCVAVLLQSGDDSDQLERFFSQLAAAPFTRGDYREDDVHGRTVEVVLHEHWVIAYWADHAVKQVHIVDIEDVG